MLGLPLLSWGIFLFPFFFLTIFSNPQTGFVCVCCFDDKQSQKRSALVLSEELNRSGFAVQEKLNGFHCT